MTTKTTREAATSEPAIPAGAMPAAAGRVPAPPLVRLDDPRATAASLAGAKAAALARATAAGLPVLPGFVVTTSATEAWARPPASPLPAGLREAWRRISEDGRRSLVVRSSSTTEDGEASSLAGMFTSVLDVRGWSDFLDAVGTVLSSRKAVPGIETAPMAVLVQPLLDARLGGVLFGADPVTGRTDRLVVAAAEGAPEQVVSGAVDGAQYVLSPRGRKVAAERPLPGLGRAERRALARLARRVAAVFGGPQDVEWAFEGTTLRLLQCRPITAAASPVPGTGPLLGAGPVAETFPDPLSPLEEDLWVAPLRAALSEAVLLTGAASRRRVERSPVVASVGGRVAADLELLGAGPPRRGLVARLDPTAPARRLVASWRVGRLGAALPSLVEDLLEEVDGHLLDVPPLAELGRADLVGLLERTRRALVSLNGYEVLAGLLVDTGAPATTGASLALRVLAEGRAAGRPDVDIALSAPVVLALVPPRIGPAAALPATVAVPDAPSPAPPGDDAAALLREALRLRVRWLQELSARAAWELGLRLADAGVIPEASMVRWLRLPELTAALAGAVPGDLAERRERPVPAPLPAAFRLSAAGEVVAERTGPAEAGRGAGGGRGTGPVHQGDGAPVAGAVLVVRTLDPGLAATLPHLGGLVAETGSVLSHLAILAREFGVPTAVGVPDALRRFPPGSTVMVDGATGEVRAVDPAPGPAAAGGDDDAVDVIDLREPVGSRHTEGAMA